MSRLVLALGILALAATAVPAAAPTTLDAAPTGIAPTAPMAIGDSPAPPAVAQRPRGNPLWGVPLSVLSATRERPIFLPSRRPISPVIATPAPTAPAPAAPAPEPERPRLALVGAIVRDSEEAIAIFIDQASRSVVRLRTGEKHGEWLLTAVKGRTATFQKDRETLVIELPAPGTPPTPAGSPGAPVVPAAVTAPGSAGDPSSAEAGRPEPGTLITPDPNVAAPYVPRSTPKNGESDGL